ncbi:MAG TPA: diadenylate cyclase CdaA [bacterium]
MSILHTITIIDVLDLVVLTILIYQVLVILQRTRATQLILGIFYFVVIFALAFAFGMTATTWLFRSVGTVLAIGLLIIFQPELRSFFERAGRRGLMFRMADIDEEDIEKIIETIVQALEELASEQIGALIVVEREIGLDDYINTGERIDANIRKDLLKSIFYKGNPLHDGAVIISGDRIVSARSFLPLTESHDIPSHLGTRHRAALGITEVSDAISLVASEETGHLSLFHGGKPAFRLTPVTMRHMVRSMILPDSERETSRLFNFRQGFNLFHKSKPTPRDTEKEMVEEQKPETDSNETEAAADTAPAAE